MYDDLDPIEIDPDVLFESEIFIKFKNKPVYFFKQKEVHLDEYSENLF
jgi:hypothetical protein